MNVYFTPHRNHAPQTIHENQAFYTDRIGFWATVTGVNSQMNTVNVISDLGIEYQGIRVASREWMNNDENKDFVSGSRNLPMIGSNVFCLMPNKSVDSAFVLCSGFALGDSNTGDFLASDETEKGTKDNTSEMITQSGWRKEEVYTNGKLTLISPDKKINIEILPADDGDTKKSISITAWDNVITINNDDGIQISAKSKINLTTESTLTLTAKDNVTLDASGKDIAFTCKNFKVNDTALTVTDSSSTETTNE